MQINGLSEDRGQSVAIDNIGNAYLGGYVTGGSSSINFNGKFLSLPANKVDLFIAKYDAATLTAKWVRNLDMTVSAGSTENEVNALALSNGQLILSGDFSGSGDFNPCITTTVFSSSTTDAFIASYNPDDFMLFVPDYICPPSQNLLVTGVPPGSIITWTTNPTNLLDPNMQTGTSSSFTVYPIGRGPVVVTASYVYGTCTESLSRNAWVGVPYDANLPNVISECETIQATIAPTQGALSYNWYYNGSFYSSTTDPILEIFPTTPPPTFTIGVSACNPCGCSRIGNRYSVNNCQKGGTLTLSSVSVSPNPTSQSLAVKIQQNPISEKLDFSYDVIMYNYIGETVYTISSSDNSISIEVNQWPKGIYYIRIKTDDSDIEKRVLIN